MGLTGQMRLFLDVTRICSRVLRSTPTGIDRIDLDYLGWTLDNHRTIAAECVVTTRAFVGSLHPSLVGEIASAIRQHWTRDMIFGEDLAFNQIRTLLETNKSGEAKGCQRIQVRKSGVRHLNSLSAPLASLLMSQTRLRRSLRTMAPAPSALYIHTSHTQLEHANRFRWLRRPGIDPVFFIHDTIPVDFPEFSSPGSSERHERRLETVSRQASRVIVNSEATRQALTTYWRERTMRTPPVDVVPLGVADCFRNPAPMVPIRSARPYFVCIGTIEPRKNHLLLFSIWRELVRRFGDNAPKLVLVGRRGWQNENICDVLERSRQLSDHVVEVSGLGDRGLASLLGSSCGLLAPSIAEGFGLPVAEGLALGVPVIASDIEAHREVAAGCAHLVNPHDSMGWVEAICGQMASRDWVWNRISGHPDRYRCLSSADHVNTVFEGLLGQRPLGTPAPSPARVAA